MSPRTTKQFEEIRIEKKNLIMDVALEHFASKGFHATTISHIARHAGISKGLMYNYFSSKEELLKELIKRSSAEVFLHFDPDRDGMLSEDEFEYFIRNVTLLLKEKRSIWRLFFQMMMQKEVRQQFEMPGQADNTLRESKNLPKDEEFIPGITAMISDYFIRKKGNKGKGYDPELEKNMFLMTLKGFAVTFIFSDNDDETYFKKTVDNIIEKYR